MKKLRKLTLKKEIIATLNESEMRSVVGGATADVLGYCQPNTTPYARCPVLYSAGCGGGNPSNDCTRPPRCCNYGCCETLYC